MPYPLRKQGLEAGKPEGFVPAHHQIEVLDRLTAGAFDQIGDYRNHHNPALDPIRIDRNPAIIGAAHMPRVGGRRAERENRYEGRISILRLQRCLDLIDISPHMARDKFAARHRNQVRRERHANIAAPGLLIELLLDLRLHAPDVGLQRTLAEKTRY